MGSRKRKYVPRLFESCGQSWDTSANIYNSMLLSDAWQDLTAQQQALYVVCKAQLYAEQKKPVENDELSFTMNRHKFVEVYKLYSDGNKAGFYRDMRSLINHGFIVCVLSGRITREKSIYRFSSAWRRWGQPEFTIEPGQPVGPKKARPLANLF